MATSTSPASLDQLLADKELELKRQIASAAGELELGRTRTPERIIDLCETLQGLQRARLLLDQEHRGMGREDDKVRDMLRVIRLAQMTCAAAGQSSLSAGLGIARTVCAQILEGKS